MAGLAHQASVPGTASPPARFLGKFRSLVSLIETTLQALPERATTVQPPPKPLPNILIVHEHPLVRRGVKAIVAEEFGRGRLGEAADAARTLALVRQQVWDLLILEIPLPDTSGLEVLQQVRRLRPRLPILAFSPPSGERWVARAFRAGATGYVTIECLPEELVHATKTVLKGEVYVGATPAHILALALAQDEETPLHETLSPREDQVMRRLAAGKTVGAIAKELFLSVKTVHTHRAHILAKMHMKSPLELMQYALRQGLIS